MYETPDQLPAVSVNRPEGQSGGCGLRGSSLCEVPNLRIFQADPQRLPQF